VLALFPLMFDVPPTAVSPHRSTVATSATLRLNAAGMQGSPESVKTTRTVTFGNDRGQRWQSVKWEAVPQLAKRGEPTR